MITIDGESLTVADIAAVGRGAQVQLSPDTARLQASVDHLSARIAAGEQIYAVTTLTGGQANGVVPRELLSDFQRSVIGHLKASTGPLLSTEDVRAGMLLRANSMTRGVSAVRLELLERFPTFLNAGAVPQVPELGSIGASGDLVPLGYVAGAIAGFGPRYLVDLKGETLDGITALGRLGLEPIPLWPKEGAALVNGTSMSTGIAANNVHRAQELVAVAFGVHALCVQALLGTDQSFRPFIHRHKPHPGQVFSAARMLDLLRGSSLTRDESGGNRTHRAGHLIQDRYALRCLPQFTGPIVDGIAQIRRQIETEANSATDNPLIDVTDGEIYHGGNFLAQYVGIGMDQLRHYLGLLAQHLDVQIAFLVSPEFNHGLPPQLRGNETKAINVGLMSLQLVCNSIMPLLSFHGNSLVDRFPSHAEQFNQNINSQSYGSATLARRSLDLLTHYLANALLFGVQAVELRSNAVAGTYDARRVLSPATKPLYEAVYRVLDREPSSTRPLVLDDTDQALEDLVAPVLADLDARRHVLSALARTVEAVANHQ